MALDAEVIVVGAGPAGTATALHLANRGHDVVLLDRATFPRDKACGEGLMPHGVEALSRLGIVADGAPFGGVAYHAAGRSAVGRFPDGRFGVGLARRTFDAHLVDIASRHPRIQVRTGLRATGLAGRPGEMVVSTARRPLRSRVVVGADGLGSAVRTWAGLARRPGGDRRYGLRVHVGVPADRPCGVVEVHLTRGAELYVTPLGPGGGADRHVLNVAALLDRDGARALRGDAAGGLRRILEACPSLQLGPMEVLGDVMTWGPLRRIPSDVVADGVVLVGDAAGVVDAITGEGMSLGLASAEIAAEVVSTSLGSGRLDRGALRPYAIRRRRMARHLTWLTETVLYGLRRPRLAAHVVSNLAREPEVFERLLGVAIARRPIWSIGAGGVWRMLRPC
jgi:2-polyprenyl-6-methoxyphenol hydroxylase-like FAD-dependent oxidoreductase